METEDETDVHGGELIREETEDKGHVDHADVGSSATVHADHGTASVRCHRKHRSTSPTNMSLLSRVFHNVRVELFIHSFCN